MKTGSPLRRSLILIFGMIAVVLVYAYGFEKTDVNLDEIQSETRQENLVRVLRALANPDLVTYERVETEVSAPIYTPCPAGGYEAPEPDTSGAYLVVTPPCADPQADVDEALTTPNVANAQVESQLIPALVQAYPGLRWTAAGSTREQNEDLAAIGSAFVIVLLVIFALIATQLRSYLQPLAIIISIPLGVAGAVLGHLVLCFSLSFMTDDYSSYSPIRSDKVDYSCTKQAVCPSFGSTNKQFLIKNSSINNVSACFFFRIIDSE